MTSQIEFGFDLLPMKDAYSNSENDFQPTFRISGIRSYLNYICVRQNFDFVKVIDIGR